MAFSDGRKTGEEDGGTGCAEKRGEKGKETAIFGFFSYDDGGGLPFAAAAPLQQQRPQSVATVRVLLYVRAEEVEVDSGQYADAERREGETRLSTPCMVLAFGRGEWKGPRPTEVVAFSTQEAWAGLGRNINSCPERQFFVALALQFCPLV